MKKFTSIFLSLFLIGNLSACGTNNSTNSNVSKESEKNSIVDDNNTNKNKEVNDKSIINIEDNNQVEYFKSDTENKNDVSDSNNNTDDKNTERTNPYEVAGIDDPNKFEEMFTTVQKLIAEDNKEKLAQYISYPVFHNNEHTAIKNEEDFIRNYDKLFTEGIKKAIANKSIQRISWRGVEIGEGGDTAAFNENGIYRIINDYEGAFDCEEIEEPNELIIELDFSNENFDVDAEVGYAIRNMGSVVYNLLVKDVLKKDEISALRTSGLFGTIVSVMDDESCFADIFSFYYPSNDFLKENFLSINEFMEKLPKRLSNTENNTKENNLLEKLLVFSEDIDGNFRNKVKDAFSKIDYEYLKGLAHKDFKIKFKASSNTKNLEENSNNELSLRDYYPTYLYDTKTFQGGFENGGEVHSIDTINGDKVQWRYKSDGTWIAVVVQVTDDEVVLLNSKEEVYEFEDLTDMKQTRNEILLKTPLKLGNAWSLTEGETRTITGINVKVSTPAGEYEAIEVTTNLADGNNYKTYYAPGVGLIKESYIYDGSEMGITLEKIHKNTMD